jgi:hypothetical protein
MLNLAEIIIMMCVFVAFHEPISTKTIDAAEGGEGAYLW